MYTASISAGSFKSNSVKSYASGGSYRSWVPAKWQRGRSRSGNEVQDSSECSPKQLYSVQEYVKDDDSVSQARHPSYLSQNHPNAQGCSMESQRKHPQKPTNLRLKPLPSLPETKFNRFEYSVILSPSNLTPNTSAFSKEVETRFLPPLEQQILQCIQRLSEPPTSPANVLVQLGDDAFWMSRRDADALQRIAFLTNGLSKQEKAELLEGLRPVLKPAYSYPLKQVVLRDVKILRREQDRESSGDNESIIDLYSEDIEEGSENLIPDPLQVCHESKDTHKTRLNPSYQLSQPAKDSGGSLYPLKQLKTAERTSKQPGSVSRARARLLESQRQAREDPIQLHTALKISPSESDEANEPKSAGSVKNARLNLFLNPRPAPKPPVSVARPIPQQHEEDVPKQLGSVARARLAAQEALSVSRQASHARSISNVEARTTEHGAKRAGSVQRAQEGLALRQRGDGDRFPKHVSSLPLLQVEQHRANFESARSQTDSTDTDRRWPFLNTIISTSPNSHLSNSRPEGPNLFPLSQASQDSPKPIPPPKPFLTINDITSLHPASCLRGGGEEPDAEKPRRRTFSFWGRKYKVLDDDEKPSKKLWWLAGRPRPVMTAGECRERGRKIEEKKKKKKKKSKKGGGLTKGGGGSTRGGGRSTAGSTRGGGDSKGDAAPAAEGGGGEEQAKEEGGQEGREVEIVRDAEAAPPLEPPVEHYQQPAYRVPSGQYSQQRGSVAPPGEGVVNQGETTAAPGW